MDIITANARAQAAFRAMLAAGTLADPDAPETRAYVAAERVMDDIIVAAQWDHAKVAMDAAQATDHDYHTYAAYFDPICDSCTVVLRYGSGVAR